MSQLDVIRKKVLVESETVNADWASPSVSLDDRADEFSISLKYDNGSTVNMVVWFQLSNDNVNFADVVDSNVIITDNSGVVIFDLSGSGAIYARVRVAVTSGSIDVLDVKYMARQFH